MTTIKKTDNNKCHQRCKEIKTLTHCSCNKHFDNLIFWETIWYFVKIPSRELPSDLAIFLPDTYSRRMKTCIHPKSRTWMFTTTDFIIAKKWKKFKCPRLINVWILWCNNITAYVFGNKDRKFWHMLQPRWGLKLLCYGEGACHKRSHIAWLHLGKMSRISKSTQRK